MIHILLVLACLQSEAPPPIPHQAFDPSVPPTSARPEQGVIQPIVHQDQSLRGHVQISTTYKQVSINWVFRRDDAIVRTWQVVPVTYWPTAAASDEGRLFVAGKRRNANTRIEMWTFQHPNLPETGESYAPEKSVEILFDANEVGRRNVRFMHPLRGSSTAQGSLLVQFVDSNDLYALDIASHQLSLVLSATLVSPLADPAWDYIWSGDHPARGYVYVYQPDLDGPPANRLALVDADRNGSIDGWLSFDPQQWNSLLGNPGTWSQVFE